MFSQKKNVFCRCIYPGCARKDGWREERFVRKHIRAHHLAVDDRTCRLLTCGIKFKSKYEREQHEEVHHPQFVEKVKSGQIFPCPKNQTGWTGTEPTSLSEQVKVVKDVTSLRKGKDGKIRELSGRGFHKPVPKSDVAKNIQLPEFEGSEQEKYEQLQTWLRQFVATKPKPPEYANINNFFKLIPFNVSVD